MNELSISMSVFSFLLVFSVLVLLAIVMDIITRVFPVVEKDTDSAWLAAINSAYAEAYPGTKITNIQAK